MNPLLELIRELATHPTLREFVAWLFAHAEVIRFLMTHPLIRQIVRQSFGF